MNIITWKNIDNFIFFSETCPPVETDPASASCNPVWNATSGFGGLTADLLAGRAIELTLWDACPGIDPLLIGECTVSIVVLPTFTSKKKTKN